MPFLKDHIRKPWVSADAGEEVTIVADHADVQIVATAAGVRFSVRTEDLSESRPEDLPLKPVDRPEPAGRRMKRSRSSQPGEQTLFDKMATETYEQ